MSGEQTGTSAANSLAGDPGKTAGMKFIARQPVFDRKQRIFGYELLFRSSSENSFDGRDVNQASLNVIANGVLFHVLEELTEKHKAFVNFSRDALLGDYALFLPKELTIVEVLEGVSIDDDVLSGLTRLKDKCYCIALDDVVSTERLHNLLDLVHIVKVDMALSTPDQRQDLAEILAPRGISLLAEKVETHDQFCEAADLGFHYFQGYFFARPLVISRRDIPAFQANYFRMLQAIHRPQLDRKEIERLIKQESSFCYKLLRYLNSPFFGFRSTIQSIRHAVSLLGERHIKNWASMLVLTALSDDRPEELIATSLRRAHFCEALAGATGYRGREDDLFLLGLLSLIDAILGRPKSEIFAQLPIQEEIKSALLEQPSRMRTLLHLIEAYEKADWDQVSLLAGSLHVEEEAVTAAYLASVEWAREVIHLN